MLVSQPRWNKEQPTDIDSWIMETLVHPRHHPDGITNPRPPFAVHRGIQSKGVLRGCRRDLFFTQQP